MRGVSLSRVADLPVLGMTDSHFHLDKVLQNIGYLSLLHVLHQEPTFQYRGSCSMQSQTIFPNTWPTREQLASQGVVIISGHKPWIVWNID